jgi:methylated-DNA-[protein]-cysteine S-methyltransferase
MRRNTCGCTMRIAAMIELHYDLVDTPVGPVRIVCDVEGRIRACDWVDHDARYQRQLERHYGIRRDALRPAKDPFGFSSILRRYMAGEIAVIDDLPVETVGTDFQKDVWRELRRIPAGTTISYGQLAERIGRPRAVRAVGLANGSNPIGIIVPCHRVIGANGKLTGFGGGLHRKEWLLRHEAQWTSPLFQLA